MLRRFKIANEAFGWTLLRVARAIRPFLSTCGASVSEHETLLDGDGVLTLTERAQFFLI